MAAVSIGKSAHVAYGMLRLESPVHASSDAHRTCSVCLTSHKRLWLLKALNARESPKLVLLISSISSQASSSKSVSAALCKCSHQHLYNFDYRCAQITHGSYFLNMLINGAWMSNPPHTLQYHTYLQSLASQSGPSRP